VVRGRLSCGARVSSPWRRRCTRSLVSCSVSCILRPGTGISSAHPVGTDSSARVLGRGGCQATRPMHRRQVYRDDAGPPLRTSTAIPYGDWLDRANGDSAVPPPMALGSTSGRPERTVRLVTGRARP